MSMIGNVVNARMGVACSTCTACRKWRCSIITRTSATDREHVLRLSEASLHCPSVEVGLRLRHLLNILTPRRHVYAVSASKWQPVCTMPFQPALPTCSAAAAQKAAEQAASSRKSHS